MGFRWKNGMIILLSLFCMLNMVHAQEGVLWAQSHLFAQYREAGRNGQNQVQSTYGNYTPRTLTAGLSLAAGVKLAPQWKLGLQLDNQHQYTRHQADAKFWIHQTRIGPLIRFQPSIGRFYFPLQAGGGWERYNETFYERSSEAFKSFKKGNLLYIQGAAGFGVMLDANWRLEILPVFTYDTGELAVNIPGALKEDYYDYSLQLRAGIVYSFSRKR
ncbi:MAG: hypothetical protein AAF388_00775 [Bacteroidota bacterium]